MSTRERFGFGGYTWHTFTNGALTNVSPWYRKYVKEYISTRRISKGKSVCKHSKLLQAQNGSWSLPEDWNPPYKTLYTSDNYIGKDVSALVLRPEWEADLASRVWKRIYRELSLDSGFELINFLAEIDDTLAMFSWKFLRDISYGSVTWGIVPFITDLRNLLLSLKSIWRNLSNKRVSITIPFSYVFPFDHISLVNQNLYGEVFTADGTVRINGVLSLPSDQPLNKALTLLDRLGVHPDLLSAWDLVPLSFVVDYFLPIGDILESLHPRGWSTEVVSLTGYYSQTSVLSINDSSAGLVNGKVVQNRIWNPALVRVYTRTVDELPVNASALVKWHAPSMKELFNTAYLTSILKHVF